MWVIVRHGYPSLLLHNQIFDSAEAANAYRRYLEVLEIDGEVDYFVYKLVDLSGR